MSYIERKQVNNNDPAVVAYMLLHREVEVRANGQTTKSLKEIVDAIKSGKALYLQHKATNSSGSLTLRENGQLEFSYDTDYATHSDKAMTLYEMFVSSGAHPTEAYLQAAVMMHQDQLGNQYEVLADVLGVDNVWHAGEMKIFQSDSQSQLLGATSI